MSIVTEADQILFESMVNCDLSWFGRNVTAMLGGCQRTAPFETANVVAWVCFQCTLSVHAMCERNHVVSHDIFWFLQRFAKRKMDWPEFVDSCGAMQKELRLSEGFCHDALCFFRRHACFFISFLQKVPGDIAVDADDNFRQSVAAT